MRRRGAANYRRSMPRQPRLLVPDATYHVTARGNRRQAIFNDDYDYRLLLLIVGDVVARYGWRCHAYCLLPNHFHLLVETPGTTLSAGMHRLNGRYAQWFNDRHGLDGHLFQGRFHSVVIETEGHLLGAFRYILLNPVRASLCSSPDRWTWSSYRATVGSTGVPPFLAVDELIALFSPDARRARDRIRAFIDDAPAGRPHQ